MIGCGLVHITISTLSFSRCYSLQDFIQYVLDDDPHDDHFKGPYEEKWHACLLTYDYIVKLETNDIDARYIIREKLQGRYGAVSTHVVLVSDNHQQTPNPFLLLTHTTILLHRCSYTHTNIRLYSELQGKYMRWWAHKWRYLVTIITPPSPLLVTHTTILLQRISYIYIHAPIFRVKKIYCMNDKRVRQDDTLPTYENAFYMSVFVVCVCMWGRWWLSLNNTTCVLTAPSYYQFHAFSFSHIIYYIYYLLERLCIYFRA